VWERKWKKASAGDRLNEMIAARLHLIGPKQQADDSYPAEPGACDLGQGAGAVSRALTAAAPPRWLKIKWQFYCATLYRSSARALKLRGSLISHTQPAKRNKINCSGAISDWLRFIWPLIGYKVVKFNELPSSHSLLIVPWWDRIRIITTYLYCHGNPSSIRFCKTQIYNDQHFLCI
jgi:hypothetical protein